MWAANTLVRRTSSGRLFIRKSPARLLVGNACDFSSSDDSGRNNGNNNNTNQRNNANQRGDNKIRRPGRRGDGGSGKEKSNFAKQFLAPAARGELKNHRSPVPRLTGRKAKGNAVRGADAPYPHEEEEEFEFLQSTMEDVKDFSLGGNNNGKPSKKMGSIAAGSPMDELPPEEQQMVQDFLQEYQLLISTDEEERYYWNERDYDFLEEAQKATLFDDLHAKATEDEDGTLCVEVDDATFAMFESASEEDVKAAIEKKEEPQKPRFTSPADDPVFEFVTEAMNIEGAQNKPPADYDRILPLQISGPTIYDFVESMMNHPTKYGEVRWDAPNPGSDREPYAKFPPNRRSPPLEFVHANRRFLYVWGLPEFLLEGETLDIENPLHCMEMQKVVGSCFDVSMDQVSVASSTSAFVGFPSIDDQKFAVAVGPMTKTIESPVVISLYDGDHTLAKEHADSVILLENLPLGLSESFLAESLFPKDQEVGEVYGVDLTIDRIAMISPSSAIVALASSDAAENAITSELVQDRLLQLGQHPLRFAKARRELILSGAHGGPDGTEPLRKLGSRLIVEGDMPTKAFFTSHAGTLFLRNLDPTVTKDEIAAFFQPFCSVSRDVQGSTEFVTCRDGLKTGRAFVGFDEVGEAEAALAVLSSSNGIIEGLKSSSTTSQVVADMVKERSTKTLASPASPMEKRPSRSEEELLDSLNNWQQFVDPADLEELQAHNISMEALDETFRAIRYHNTTFASLDQAMSTESFQPTTTVNGDGDVDVDVDHSMFAELVQTYIATLKECLSTPENPGPIFESLHFSDEAWDLDIFEEEPARQEELRKRREEGKPQ